MVWFLSSLLQQTFLPDVTINLAYTKNNGSPSTESIVDFYRAQGIKFRTIIFEDPADISFRGKLRNAQIALSKGDWLFFYDVDQVLHPDFFKIWCPTLTRDFIYYEKQKLTTTGTKVFLATNAQGRRKYVRSAFKKANGFFPEVEYNRPSGGLIFVKRALVYKVTNGLYTMSMNPHDYSFDKQTSDPIFRKMFTVRGLSLSPVIHLNHLSRADRIAGIAAQQ
jgi:hypothetical protein